MHISLFCNVTTSIYVWFHFGAGGQKIVVCGHRQVSGVVSLVQTNYTTDDLQTCRQVSSRKVHMYIHIVCHRQDAGGCAGGAYCA